MAEKTISAPQHVADADTSVNVEKSHKVPLSAQQRVDAAVKTRWSSITSNPKLILIALLAS